MTKYERLFIRSAGILLMFTGIAKLISATGRARFLLEHEPIMGISFAELLVVAGILEALVAFLCLCSKWPQLSIQLAAWLSSVILIYRVNLWWINWHRPCHCLGNLTDALHIPPSLADTFMKLILGYLLIGSYGILVHQWWRNGKLELGRSKSGGRKTELSETS